MMEPILITLGLVALVVLLAFVGLVVVATLIIWRYEAQAQMRAAKRLMGRKR